MCVYVCMHMCVSMSVCVHNSVCVCAWEWVLVRVMVYMCIQMHAVVRAALPNTASILFRPLLSSLHSLSFIFTRQ